MEYPWNAPGRCRNHLWNSLERTWNPWKTSGSSKYFLKSFLATPLQSPKRSGTLLEFSRKLLISRVTLWNALTPWTLMEPLRSHHGTSWNLLKIPGSLETSGNPLENSRHPLQYPWNASKTLKSRGTPNNHLSLMEPLGTFLENSTKRLTPLKPLESTGTHLKLSRIPLKLPRMP